MFFDVQTTSSFLLSESCLPNHDACHLRVRVFIKAANPMQRVNLFSNANCVVMIRTSLYRGLSAVSHNELHQKRIFAIFSQAEVLECYSCNVMTDTNEVGYLWRKKSCICPAFTECVAFAAFWCCSMPPFVLVLSRSCCLNALLGVLFRQGGLKQLLLSLQLTQLFGM